MFIRKSSLESLDARAEILRMLASLSLHTELSRFHEISFLQMLAVHSRKIIIALSTYEKRRPATATTPSYADCKQSRSLARSLFSLPTAVLDRAQKNYLPYLSPLKYELSLLMFATNIIQFFVLHTTRRL